MSNRLDDGFSMDEDNGLMLTPTRSSARYVSFFDKIGEREPSWFIEKNTLGGSGLNFSSKSDRLSLHFSDSGKVGVGTNEPKYTRWMLLDWSVCMVESARMRVERYRQTVNTMIF